MDIKGAIILALISMNAAAQPFTPSELGWPANTNNSSINCIPPDASTSFVIVPRNGVGNGNVYGNDPQGGKISLIKASNPANGIAVGPSFFSPTNPAVAPYAYTPNFDYVGDDSFKWFVSSHCAVVTNDIKAFVYDTNAPSSSCSSFTSTNTVFYVQLPTTPISYDADFWVYASCFTNHYVHFGFEASGLWHGPPTISGSLAIITNTCNGSTICIAYTNTAPTAPTNYCGTNLTDNITNVVWGISNPTGHHSSSLSFHTNGIITFSVTQSSFFSGAQTYIGMDICGGISDKTYTISGVMTNTTTGSSAASLSIILNSTITTITNFPNSFGTVLVTPVNYTFTLPQQRTNSVTLLLQSSVTGTILKGSLTNSVQ